ncbi:class IV adenylate cyclase [Kibdelosporangium lantanae]|uniref:Class IV adenylate cyclase n=1 Tax=Kibdelosporangium lantanae TaxID=1497396 RepID=A0ABW3M3H4_9PSEU
MEVESKVLLEPRDVTTITVRLTELGVNLDRPEIQRDVYYKERGFRDKVQGPGSYLVRVRYKQSGTVLNMKRLTNLDGVWDEVETAVDDGKVAEQIVEAIGAEHAVTVAKERRKAKDGDLEIIIDVVDGLGTFLELAIETDSDPAQARAKIDAYLDKLGIDKVRVELRGYPTILLEQQGVIFSVK